LNKLITLSVIIPLLFLVAPKAYADSKHCHRDGRPACYDLDHYKGGVDASFDYNNNRVYDSSCPSGHSDNFCAGYSDGYNNWWHQADQKNTGTQQGQSSKVNIKGNDNRVTVNQGQSVQGGSDTSGGSGSGDLPACHILCAVIK
jgi:hypothetical protein